MKAKILIGYYPLEPGVELLRIYLESDIEQAEKDLELLINTHSKTYELKDCEIYNGDNFIFGTTKVFNFINSNK